MSLAANFPKDEKDKMLSYLYSYMNNLNSPLYMDEQP